MVRSADRDFIEKLSRCFCEWDANASALTTQRPELDVTVRVRREPGSREHEALLVETIPAGAFAGDWPNPIRTPLDLCQELNRWATGPGCGRFVFHAGVIARDGAALMLPAKSGSGKTTLTVALLQRGCSWLSDEIAAVDMNTLCVCEYPRCLSVRQQTLECLRIDPLAGHDMGNGRTRMIHPGELGFERADAEARLRLIAVPQYRPGSRTALERMTAGEAVLALMEASCSTAHLRAEGFDWVISLCRTVPVYRCTYSEFGQACDLLLEELRERGLNREA